MIVSKDGKMVVAQISLLSSGKRAQTSHLGLFSSLLLPLLEGADTFGRVVMTVVVMVIAVVAV